MLKYKLQTPKAVVKAIFTAEIAARLMTEIPGRMETIEFKGVGEQTVFIVSIPSTFAIDPGKELLVQADPGDIIMLL